MQTGPTEEVATSTHYGVRRLIEADVALKVATRVVSAGAGTGGRRGDGLPLHLGTVRGRLSFPQVWGLISIVDWGRWGGRSISHVCVCVCGRLCGCALNKGDTRQGHYKRKEQVLTNRPVN